MSPTGQLFQSLSLNSPLHSAVCILQSSISPSVQKSKDTCPDPSGQVWTRRNVETMSGFSVVGVD